MQFTPVADSTLNREPLGILTLFWYFSQQRITKPKRVQPQLAIATSSVGID